MPSMTIYLASALTEMEGTVYYLLGVLTVVHRILSEEGDA